MADQITHSEQILAWVLQHTAELDALAYGSVSFVFSGRAPARVKIERASRMDDDKENGA